MGWDGGGMLTFLVLPTLYVATLQRSLVLLLRCVHEGVEWGGQVKVPCTSYVICCYAAEISGVVATLCTRRGGVGGQVNVPCTSYVICCYAAEISGVVATLCTRRGGVGGMLTFLVLRTLYVATLQRSLVLLLRCVHKGVEWGGHVNVPCTSYVICCYAAEISGVVAMLCTRRGGVGGYVSVPCTSYVICCYAEEISGVVATLCARRGGVGGRLTFLVLRTLYVATLQRSLVLLLRCVHKGVEWGGHVNVPCTSYVICCYAAEISGGVAMLCTRRDGVGGYVSVPCTSYVICCYAAEISGVVATLCARRGGVGGQVNVSCASYAICCYAAEISGVVATLCARRGGVRGER